MSNNPNMSNLVLLVDMLTNLPRLSSTPQDCHCKNCFTCMLLHWCAETTAPSHLQWYFFKNFRYPSVVKQYSNTDPNSTIKSLEELGVQNRPCLIHLDSNSH